MNEVNPAHFVVVASDGNIAYMHNRAAARRQARTMSRSGQKAVVMHGGHFIAAASNGRILPARWLRSWSDESRARWTAMAEGTT